VGLLPNQDGTLQRKKASKKAGLAIHTVTGVVKEVDTVKGKVVLDHQAVRRLNWPAMTMGFMVNDRKLLDKLKVGKRVECRRRGDARVLANSVMGNSRWFTDHRLPPKVLMAAAAARVVTAAVHRERTTSKPNSAYLVKVGCCISGRPSSAVPVAISSMITGKW